MLFFSVSFLFLFLFLGDLWWEKGGRGTARHGEEEAKKGSLNVEGLKGNKGLILFDFIPYTPSRPIYGFYEGSLREYPANKTKWLDLVKRWGEVWEVGDGDGKRNLVRPVGSGDMGGDNKR